MGKDDLELSLIDSVRDSGLPADLGEVGLDALLDPGILRDIPVLGTIQKVCNVAETISNRLFAKKMLRFLAGVSRIPQDERQKQTAKLLVSREEQLRVGEFLFLLLDKLDDIAKAELVAKVFGAYLREKVTLNEMMSLGRAINALSMGDIETVESRYGDIGRHKDIAPRGRADLYPLLKGSWEGPEEDASFQALANVGLAVMDWVPETDGHHIGMSGGKLNFRGTRLGHLLWKVLSE